MCVFDGSIALDLPTGWYEVIFGRPPPYSFWEEILLETAPVAVKTIDRITRYIQEM